MKINPKSVLKWIWTTLSIGIAFGYFYYRSPKNFFDFTLKIDFLLLCLGVLSYIGFVLVSTYRWMVLLNFPIRKLPIKKLIIITTVAKGLGSITPMNAGEFLKAEFSYKLSETTRFKQYTIVAIERGLDILTLLCLALLGLMAQTSIRVLLQNKLIILLLVVLVVLGVITFVVMILYDRVEKVKAKINEMGELLKIVIAKKQVILLTLLNWLCITILWWSLFSAFHLPVTLTDVFILLSLVTFVMIASLLPGGIGLADMTASELAIQMGYQPKEAILFPLAIRVNTLISLILGAIAWIYLNWKIQIKKESIEIE
ncbi:MAG: flippase-like domain-containing protein [bacterium]|nr:flippase-like domain-containing protein [bacterium]